jgi:hypothetical protein
MHEDFSRSEAVKGSSDRSFGFVMAGFFALVAVIPVIRDHGSVRWWAVGVALVALATALLWPSALAPLNRLWFKLSLLLNRIVSPVALGLLFFVAVTPIGLLMRLFGQDPLRLRMDPKAQSYWIPRIPPGPSPESMKQLF